MGSVRFGAWKQWSYNDSAGLKDLLWKVRIRASPGTAKVGTQLFPQPQYTHSVDILTWILSPLSPANVGHAGTGTMSARRIPHFSTVCWPGKTPSQPGGAARTDWSCALREWSEFPGEPGSAKRSVARCDKYI